MTGADRAFVDGASQTTKNAPAPVPRPSGHARCTGQRSRPGFGVGDDAHNYLAQPGNVGSATSDATRRHPNPLRAYRSPSVVAA